MTGAAARWAPARRLAGTAGLVLLVHAWLLTGGQPMQPAPPTPDIAPRPAGTVELLRPRAAAVAAAALPAALPASPRGGSVHGATDGPVHGPVHGTVHDTPRRPSPRPAPVPDRPAPAPDAAAAHPPAPQADAQPAPAGAPAPVPAPAVAEGDTPAAAGAEPLPLYQPLLPQAAELHFDASRGAMRGHAVLAWAPQAGGYELALTVTPHGGHGALRQRSSGDLGMHGLAPRRFVEGRAGRGERAATFRRDEGLVSFSASTDRLPLPEGLQDRLAWLVQLVGVMNARRAAGHPMDEPVVLGVAGLRGGLARWTFTVRPGTGTSPPADRPAWTLVREPDGPYDTRVELALDAAAPHWPLWLRYTEARGEPLLLARRAQSATP